MGARLTPTSSSCDIIDSGNLLVAHFIASSVKLVAEGVRRVVAS